MIATAGMTIATVTVLVVAAALFAVRLVIGPTLADRVVALNGIVTVGIALLAVHAVNSDRNSYLSVLVVLAVVGFVGTAMIARFLRGRRL